MKSNIDLTENRDFRTRLRVIGDEKRHKIPWNIRPHPHYGEYLSYYEEQFEMELMVTGNKEDRSRKRMRLIEYEREQCERCGIFFHKKPWLKEYEICINCADEIKPKNNIWWLKKKDNIIPQIGVQELRDILFG